MPHQQLGKPAANIQQSCKLQQLLAEVVRFARQNKSIYSAIPPLVLAAWVIVSIRHRLDAAHYACLQYREALHVPTETLCGLRDEMATQVETALTKLHAQSVQVIEL